MQTEPQNVIDPSGLPTFYTPTPVWIMLADIRPQAKIAWMFLAEHANVGRQMGVQKLPCPKMETIAKAVGTSRQRLREYFNELKAIGALVVEEYRYAGGMRRGYRYRPIFNPPASYSGPASLREFYDGRDGAQFEWMAHRQEAANSHETASQPGGCRMATADGSHPATVDGAQMNPAQGNPVQEIPLSLSSVVAKAEGARGRASTSEREKAATPKDKTSQRQARGGRTGAARVTPSSQPATALPGQRAGEVDKLERVPTDVPGAFQPFQAPVPTDAPHTPQQAPHTPQEAAHDDVRIAEAWIASRQAHGHGVPARARTRMINDAAKLLAEGENAEQLVAAAADMGKQANWFDLARHLEKFVPQPKVTVPGQRPALPEWCGVCNDGVEPAGPGQRFREKDGRMVRCHCHPSAVAPQPANTPPAQPDCTFDGERNSVHIGSILQTIREARIR